MKQQVGSGFHAAHLRIEQDANGWNQWGGGATGALLEYIKVMAGSAFTNTTTVYVASGLLYNGPSLGGWAGSWAGRRSGSRPC